ncbi:HAD-IIIA family hydrolase [Oleisolibacter albus]|uniref:HAD-IIIA family hydrolase n=1 Tax=Oleisolibacter albus TaxID=2171757 RepID=UPI000DF2C734|nr:HAD-IIIA family hydrolase [Oleisolibacter albus]
MLTQAMILCGGLGSRLGSLTAKTPKPLLPVAGAPFLDVLLLELARHGFRDIIFLAAFEAQQIEAYIEDHPIARQFGLSLSLVVEPERAGTGGAIHNARDRITGDFLLMNGDSWFDINLLEFLRQAANHPAAPAVLALRHVADASRSGVVTLDGDRISEFLERPPGPGPGLVNAGIYVIRPALLNRLQPVCSFERDILPTLAAEASLAGFRHEGYFIDIGIPTDYERAQTEIPQRLRRPAVFLDRDGVINHDDGYVGNWDRFRWIEGAPQAIAALNDAGFSVFVVTNQAGVARGYYDESAVGTLHARINQELRNFGAHIDDFRYCPHHPDGDLPGYRQTCSWRKPEPGMLQDLMAHWSVDAARSCMIGDKDLDVEAARRAGIPGHLFTGGNLRQFISTLGLIPAAT